MNVPFHAVSAGSGRSAALLAATILAGAAAMCGSATTAAAGPCTAQIAQVEQQIAQAPPGPETGPTGPQSVGAQLHHQPTPGTIEHAEIKASTDGDAALDRARKADHDGDAAACDQAVREARRLYGID
jgi:hypothetical protein